MSALIQHADFRKEVLKALLGFRAARMIASDVFGFQNEIDLLQYTLTTDVRAQILQNVSCLVSSHFPRVRGFASSTGLFRACAPSPQRRKELHQCKIRVGERHKTPCLAQSAYPFRSTSSKGDSAFSFEKSCRPYEILFGWGRCLSGRYGRGRTCSTHFLPTAMVVNCCAITTVSLSVGRVVVGVLGCTGMSTTTTFVVSLAHVLSLL